MTTDLVLFLFGYLFQLFLWVDAQYHFREKFQDFTIYCIKYGIEADEKYHLHEYITEGIYMMIVAGLKAVVAFKETPRYKESSIIIEQKTTDRTYIKDTLIIQPQEKSVAISSPEQKLKGSSKSWLIW